MTTKPRGRTRLRRWLAAWWWPLAAAAIGTLLALPSLSAGWVGDDYWHRYILTDGGKHNDLGILKSDSFTQLYAFLDGDPGRNQNLIDQGIAPWWMSLNIKGAFWRPITGLTYLLDYRLWPTNSALMHLHSLLWNAAMILLVGLLHRRLLGPTWVAGLATVLYAIDDARGTPIGFLANRHAIVAAVLGLGCLVAHDRWRRDGWRPGQLVGPILFGLGLLSSEAGIATTAYLLAHALFLDHGAWRHKTLVLLPYAAIVVVWRIIWSALGFGFSGAELYADPLAHPLTFALRVATQLPIFLFGQWVLISDLAVALSGSGAIIFGWVATSLVAAVGLLLWRRIQWDSAAKFFGLGMVLSVIPLCAAFPSDRMLSFVGFGATPLLALFLAEIAKPADLDTHKKARNRLARACAAFLVFMHALIAPVGLALRSGNPIGPMRLMKSLYELPTDEAVRRQTLVFVNPPIALMLGFARVACAVEGRPYPRYIRILSASAAPTDLTRLDAKTIAARPDGGFLSYLLDGGFRSKNDRFTLGQRIELPDMTVEITDLTSDGRPAEATYHFDVPLEDDSLRWLQWKEDRYVPFAPPAVGQTAHLSALGLTG